jgi:hypothetical protein
MECGHDRCRHWWACQGRYLWYDGANSNSPVACVLSSTSITHLPLTWFPSNFIPRQPAVVYLKKLNPDKSKITVAHVLKSLGDAGRRFTEDKIQAKVVEFRAEADMVINWGYEQVQKRMLSAAAKLDLKLDGDRVVTFEDLKKCWEVDGGTVNTGKFYMICYGDYEGANNQHWGRELELQYMRAQFIEYDVEPRKHDKGGYEQCITHAKGNMVKSIMARSNKSHKGKIVLSLKNTKDLAESVKDKSHEKQTRRKEGEFFYKKNVRNCGVGQCEISQY